MRSTVKVDIRIDAYTDLFKRTAHTQAERTLQSYADNVKKVLSTPPARTGRIYHDLPGKSRHQASAPGEPPAPLTGFLRDSIRTNIADKNHKIIGTVTTDAPYAAELELGLGKFRDKARPAWMVTIFSGRSSYRQTLFSNYKKSGKV